MTRKLPKLKRIKDMTPDEKKVLSQRIQLYGGVALIFILCALFLRFSYTSTFTTHLRARLGTPSGAMPGAWASPGHTATKRPCPMVT